LAKKSKEEVARGGRFRALIWLAVLLACTHAAMGWAGDIRVLSTPTLKSALHELVHRVIELAPGEFAALDRRTST